MPHFKKLKTPPKIVAIGHHIGNVQKRTLEKKDSLRFEIACFSRFGIVPLF